MWKEVKVYNNMLSASYRILYVTHYNLVNKEVIVIVHMKMSMEMIEM